MLGPHLHQSRHGALKFKRLIAFRVKLLWRPVSRGNELYFGLIKRINERDKAHRLIFLLRLQKRNIIQHQTMKMRRQRQIIGGPARFDAKRVKVDTRHPARRARHIKRSALQFKHGRCHRHPFGQALKAFIQCGARFRPAWGEPNRRRSEARQTVVFLCRQLVKHMTWFHHFDKGHKAMAVETALL